MQPIYAVPLTVGLAGAGAVAYAGYEARAYRIREVEVPVLASGAGPLRVLHLSDVHLTPRQKRKRAFLASLAALEPDLVVSTGDLIAHRDAVPVVLEALRGLLDRPGAFVFGSNDYYAPQPKNPARYLMRDTGRRIHGERLPWEGLRDGLAAAGWVDLTNRRDRLKAGGLEVEVVGVDDPHLRRDRYDLAAGPADVRAGLALGVTHSPEPWVLDRMAADGFRMIVAGHTHGGQLCLPLYGTLVTNCALDRHRAKGLSLWDADGLAGGPRLPDPGAALGPRQSWLHVSPGLGTSPYTPVRFACPPEVTLLRLVASD